MEIYATFAPILVMFIGGWTLFSSGYSFDLRAKNRQNAVGRRRRASDRTRPLPSLR